MMILGLKTTWNKDFTLIISISVSPSPVVENERKSKQITNKQLKKTQTNLSKLHAGSWETEVL